MRELEVAGTMQSLLFFFVFFCAWILLSSYHVCCQSNSNVLYFCRVLCGWVYPSQFFFYSPTSQIEIRQFSNGDQMFRLLIVALISAIQAVQLHENKYKEGKSCGNKRLVNNTNRCNRTKRRGRTQYKAYKKKLKCSILQPYLCLSFW